MDWIEIYRKAKPHRWSGWPGAFCLDCGLSNWEEWAIGEGWLNPYIDRWNGWINMKIAMELHMPCLK